MLPRHLLRRAPRTQAVCKRPWLRGITALFLFLARHGPEPRSRKARAMRIAHAARDVVPVRDGQARRERGLREPGPVRRESIERVRLCVA
jgi:hypothetical protein